MAFAAPAGTARRGLASGSSSPTYAYGTASGDDTAGLLEEGEDDPEKAWKISVLFLSFIVVTVVFGHLMSWSASMLHKKRLKALKHTFHKLKEEFTLLGLISLLLVASEETLLESCVIGVGSGRRLLAVSAGAYDCKKTFWSYQTVHEIHVFVFIMSVTHILVCTASVVLFTSAIRKWRVLEDRVRAGECIEEAPVQLPFRYGSVYGRAFVAQFHTSISTEIYLSLRRLFVDRTQVLDNFDFAAFLEIAMVEDFASIMGLNWGMFLLAALVIVTPNSLEMQYWLPALFLVFTLIMGTKLELIALQMAFHSGHATSLPAVTNTATNNNHPGPADAGTLPAPASSPLMQRTKSREGLEHILGDPQLQLEATTHQVYILFESSLSVAIAIFSLWKEPDYFNPMLNIQNLPALLILLAVDVVLVLHSSMYVLPSYALTASVGSHCAQSIQKHVRKHSKMPAMVVKAFAPQRTEAGDRLEEEPAAPEESGSVSGLLQSMSGSMHWFGRKLSLPTPRRGQAHSSTHVNHLYGNNVGGDEDAYDHSHANESSMDMLTRAAYARKLQEVLKAKQREKGPFQGAIEETPATPTGLEAKRASVERRSSTDSIYGSGGGEGASAGVERSSLSLDRRSRLVDFTPEEMCLLVTSPEGLVNPHRTVEVEARPSIFDLIPDDDIGREIVEEAENMVKQKEAQLLSRTLSRSLGVEAVSMLHAPTAEPSAAAHDSQHACGADCTAEAAPKASPAPGGSPEAARVALEIPIEGDMMKAGGGQDDGSAIVSSGVELDASPVPVNVPATATMAAAATAVASEHPAEQLGAAEQGELPSPAGIVARSQGKADAETGIVDAEELSEPASPAGVMMQGPATLKEKLSLPSSPFQLSLPSSPPRDLCVVEMDTADEAPHMWGRNDHPFPTFESSKEAVARSPVADSSTVTVVTEGSAERILDEAALLPPPGSAAGGRGGQHGSISESTSVVASSAPGTDEAAEAGPGSLADQGTSPAEEDERDDKKHAAAHQREVEVEVEVGTTSSKKHQGGSSRTHGKKKNKKKKR